ncbi:MULTISPECIES: hypothetical protein [Janthinobacterium]|uniref:hypothetical protein n=1 Tax=Janthinobacterium TaxID=29580 RepID=UPI001C5A6999|nr:MULTISPECIES: hypothetical protein [Janthinobacterium]MBW3507440.1 hypothetical protein [Janthinobacterium sp. NKUCC06_STL]MCA1860315.1 hypothetical protein [Janthinobacterium lividum]
MKYLFSLALAVLPLAAAAQSPSAPQEAQASVPATTYRSAFAGYRPAAEEDATPDQTWRAVNDKVGKAGGHMGMMKMDGHKMEGHKMPMAQPSPKPDAKPAPQHQHHQHHQHEGH